MAVLLVVVAEAELVVVLSVEGGTVGDPVRVTYSV
jgi:hypothetical protein